MDAGAPWADLDVQRTVMLLTELSYDGWDGVDDGLDVAPDVMAQLGSMATRLLGVLRDRVMGDLDTDRDVVEWLVEVAGPLPAEADRRDGEEPTDSISDWMEHSGQLQHVREEAVLRSLYQRHEADPHTYGIPKLRGRAKVALVTIQADEYGGGRLEDMHAELFGHTMRALALDPTPRAYVDRLPAPALATSNLVSLLARSRADRGALVGHLALFEMASVPVMSSMSRTYTRLGLNSWARLFFDAHVVADAEHQRLAAHDLVGNLVADEPELADDVRFGAAALAHVEAALTDHVLGAWRASSSALLDPLDGADLDDLPGASPVAVGADPRRAA